MTAQMERPVIALMMEKTLVYQRALCSGVWEVARKYNWRILDWEMDFGFPLEAWKGPINGIIGMSQRTVVQTMAKDLGVPVVLFGTPMKEDRAHAVFQLDHDKVIQIALAHLLSLGVPNLAFCGASGQLSASMRQALFTQKVKGLGRTVRTINDIPLYWGEVDKWDRNQKKLTKWVESLPIPCGILVTEDRRAVELSYAIERLGLAVPEQIAILSINDDRVMCESCAVPVSSVALPGRQFGIQCAEMLQDLLEGGTAPAEPVKISPSEITVRASTEVIHLGDALIEKAIMTIRRKAPTHPLTVSELASGMPLSKRAFITRFEKAVGRPPKAEIDRIRSKTACDLLDQKDLVVKEVAHQMGFETPSEFSRFFRRVMHQTPSQYRMKRPRALPPHEH